MRVAPSLAHITKTSGGLIFSVIALSSPLACSAAHEAEGAQALSTDVRIPPNASLMSTCDSTANNPYVGTCVATLFSCFTPKGDCATKATFESNTLVTRTMWNDGSSVVRTLAGGTNDVRIEVRGSKGAACAAYDVVERKNSKERVTTVRDSNGADVAVLRSDQAGSTVTCPDGKQYALGGTPMEQRGCFAPTYFADRCDTVY